jgi:hypothetical protein
MWEPDLQACSEQALVLNILLFDIKLIEYKPKGRALTAIQ